MEDLSEIRFSDLSQKEISKKAIFHLIRMESQTVDEALERAQFEIFEEVKRNAFAVLQKADGRWAA